MALFGSTKGGEWYLKFLSAECKFKKAEEKYKKNPTNFNRKTMEAKRIKLKEIKNNYYD